MNEKREWLNNIEAKSNAQVVLVPNRYIETPHMRFAGFVTTKLCFPRTAALSHLIPIAPTPVVDEARRETAATAAPAAAVVSSTIPTIPPPPSVAAEAAPTVEVPARRSASSYECGDTSSVASQRRVSRHRHQHRTIVQDRTAQFGTDTNHATAIVTASVTAPAIPESEIGNDLVRSVSVRHSMQLAMPSATASPEILQPTQHLVLKTSGHNKLSVRAANSRVLRAPGRTPLLHLRRAHSGRSVLDVTVAVADVVAADAAEKKAHLKSLVRTHRSNLRMFPIRLHKLARRTPRRRAIRNFAASTGRNPLDPTAHHARNRPRSPVSDPLSAIRQGPLLAHLRAAIALKRALRRNRRRAIRYGPPVRRARAVRGAAAPARRAETNKHPHLRRIL